MGPRTIFSSEGLGWVWTTQSFLLLGARYVHTSVQTLCDDEIYDPIVSCRFHTRPLGVSGPKFKTGW